MVNPAVNGHTGMLSPTVSLGGVSRTPRPTHDTHHFSPGSVFSPSIQRSDTDSRGSAAASSSRRSVHRAANLTPTSRIGKSVYLLTHQALPGAIFSLEMRCGVTNENALRFHFSHHKLMKLSTYI